MNEDCYGIGYGIEFQLSSYRKDLPNMANLLVESMLEIEQLLTEGAKHK